MLQGFSTVNYFVDDVARATQWYAELLGFEPYFVRPDIDNPAYTEFRIGPHRHELGLISSAYRPDGMAGGSGSVTVYWQVEDVAAAQRRLVGRGATLLEQPVDRGAGWVTASVVDPFGNVLGLMHSPVAAAAVADAGNGVR